MANSGAAGLPTLDALFARFRATGDPRALGDLFDATASDLFRLALTLAPDAASAEDAVQEAFLAALQSADRFDPARPVLPWLVGILRHKVEDQRRLRRRVPDPRRTRGPAGEPDPLAEAAGHEEEARVRDAIEALPEPFRAVALLRWRYGLEPAEIAHVRGERPGAVRMALLRAKERLRVALGALAGIVVVPGERAGRGLDAVRRVVLSRAAVRTAAAGAGAGAAAALGGILVAKKMALAAVVVLLLGGAGWWALRGGEEGGSRGTAERTGSVPVPATTPAAPAAAKAGAPAAPPVPEPRDPATVSGRVVSRDGAPVAGARVASFPARAAAVRSLPGPGAPRGSARVAATGADGRFAVGLAAEGLASLVVEARGFAPGLVEGVAPGREVGVTLDRATPLVIRVKDPEGKPVAGAKVVLARTFGLTSFRDEGATDAAGELPLDWWDLNDRSVVTATALDFPLLNSFGASLEVRAAGFAPWIGGAWSRKGAFEVTLARGVRLAGRVLDAGTGEPVADAIVGLWWYAGEMRERISWMQTGFSNPGARTEAARARTGLDGTFVLDDAPLIPPPARKPGRWKAAGFQAGAWKEGFAPEVVEVVAGEDGKAGEVEIRLARAASVSGRVVNGAGRPVEGAWAWCFAAKGKTEAERRFPASMVEVPDFSAVTDGDGRYRLRGIPVPEGAIVAKVGAVVPTEGGPVPKGAVATAEISLEPGKETVAPDLVPVLPDGGWLRLRVTDRDGRPVAGAVAGEGTMVLQGPGSADPQGRIDLFFYGGPAAMKERTISVVHRGFAPSTLKATPARSLEEAAEVTVMLSPGHRISGVVVEEDGTPAPDVGVSVAPADGPLESRFPRDPMKQGEPGAWSCPGARTNGAGRFCFEDLPEGPYFLLAAVSARSAAERRVSAGPFATDAADVRIVLPPGESSPTGAVLVRVTDAATGKPVEKAWAAVLFRQMRFLGISREPGVVRIEGLPPGRWPLRVWAEGLAEKDAGTVEVVAGAEAPEVPVALDRGATVFGTLRGADAAAVAGAVVDLVPGDRTGWPLVPLRGACDARGGFRIAGVPAGRWVAQAFRLRHSSGDFLLNDFDQVGVPLVPRGEVAVDVAGGGEVRLDLAVVPAGWLEVRPADERLPIPFAVPDLVAPAQAEFGAKARVEVRDGAGRLVAAQTGLGLGYAGQATILVLSPGEYSLRLLLPGEEPREARARVEEGKMALVEFR